MENNQQNSTNINWYPGHMAKARREIQEKINLIDIFYEVIDARMPISSKIPFNDIIKDKKRIIIVSKYDLCDKEKTNKYLNEYKKECPIFIFNLKKISNSEIKKLIETESFKKSFFNYFGASFYCAGITEEELKRIQYRDSHGTSTSELAIANEGKKLLQRGSFTFPEMNNGNIIE